MNTSHFFKTLPLAALLAAAGSAQAMSHASTASNWRFVPTDTFNGASMNGVARIMYDFDGNLANGFNVCSGTLLAGGAYVLTAAHCADGANAFQVDFGVAGANSVVSRGVASTFIDPGWTGNFLYGTDLALLKLDLDVANLVQGFNLSKTNDVGQNMLMMGYGTTTTGTLGSPNWDEWGYGHYGYNTFDVTSQELLDAAAAAGLPDLGTWSNLAGEEYVADYDDGSARFNTLDLVAQVTGGGWISDTGMSVDNDMGAFEGMITGGDSGGGSFVWNGSEWLLSGVNSWSWDFCSGRLNAACDDVWGNNGSFGELMGSTAVYSQSAWIESVLASDGNPFQPIDPALSVPEPQTYSLVALGLLGATVARRRKPKA